MPRGKEGRLSEVEFVCIGTLMLDDISYPERPLAEATLGGSAVHAAAGMRVWAERIGIVARGSRAFPKDRGAQLRAYGFDLQGVTSDLKRPARARQRYDDRQRRHERFRSPRDGLRGLAIQPSDVPTEYRGARAFHVLVGNVADHLALVDALRGRPDRLILVEPYYDPVAAVPSDHLRALLSRIDAFAPDLDEARVLAASDHAPTILAELSRGGAIIVLRMGKAGAVVHDPRTKRTVHVPAIGRRVVDVTGAGNAFSGGWLVGYTQSHDIAEAAYRGAVSASFAIEQFGPAPARSDGRRASARLARAAREATSPRFEAVRSR